MSPPRHHPADGHVPGAFSVTLPDLDSARRLASFARVYIASFLWFHLRTSRLGCVTVRF